MISPLRRLAAPALAAAAVLLAAPPAHAATQTKHDGDDWTRNDLLSASWDVDATTAKLTFDLDDSADADWTYFFLDTNRDGRSEFAIDAAGNGSQQLRLRLTTTPESTATCQIGRGTDWSEPKGNSEILLDLGQVDPVVDVDAHRLRYTVSFPVSLIGGAQVFDWAAYANSFGIMASAWDYMPDAANPEPERANPVNWGGNDTCDFDGDGRITANDAWNMNMPDSQDGFVPLRMSDGFTFPDGADDPAPGDGNPGGGQGGAGAGGAGTGPGADVPADPFAGFTRTDTTRTFTMPRVTGLAADTAKERILKAGGFADFDVKETNPARPPRGIGFGDVYVQSPAAGATLSAGAGTLPKVALQVYAGPSPRGRYDCMDKLVRDLKGMEYAQALDLLKKAGCRPEYDFRLGGGDEATVTKVTPKAGDRVELQVTVPKDPRRNDLFLTFRESPNQLSFDATDWTLTADRDQRNFLTFQVVDRAGRFVQRANVRFDTSDVGAPKDPSVAVTDLRGERSTSLLAPKAGKVDVVVWAVGANDIAVYGSAQLTVKDRRAKAGARFTTTSGRVLELSKAGAWRQVASASSIASPATAHAAQAGNPFQTLWGWFTQLIGAAPRVQAVEAAGGSEQQKLNRAASGPKLFPAMLAIGGRPVGGSVVAAGGGNVVAADGGNVIAAGGGNVIAAGGGNVVAAGGGNLATVAAGGLMAVGGGKLLSDNGLGVVAPGGGNVIAAGGGNVIAAGGGNVVAAGGMNLQFAVGNGVIAAGGGNVVAAGGLN